MPWQNVDMWTVLRFQTPRVGSVFGPGKYVLGYDNPITLTDRQMQNVVPDIGSAPLRNPGKGWVLYGMPDQHRNGSLPYGAVGYTRFNWCDIEPQEGVFNWLPIDDFIAAWSGEDLPVAFGVMTANMHFRGAYVTPEWVFDAGCARREVGYRNPASAPDVAQTRAYEGVQIIPENWDDPVYMEKLDALLSAMARRYDGKPCLAWYEIRSYGNWGEGHLWPWGGTDLTPEQIFEHHIRLHQRIFRNTPLVAAETYFRTAENRLRVARIGVGVRDDGVISYRDGSTTAECDGLAMSCFEWGGTYGQFSSEGKMPRLEECIRNGHVYYCGLSRYGADDIKAFLDNERPLIDRLSNLMGYHLVLESVSMPNEITAGEGFAIGLTWRNHGVARMWFPCSAALALLDEGGSPVARTWLAESDPSACAGGQTRPEELTVSFDAVPPGAYQVAIGLFRDRGGTRPDVKLGLRAVTKENWHALASVQVTRRS